MSFIRWLRGSSSSELEENEDGAMAATTREVEKVKQVRRKRGSYQNYDDETRIKIAEYSCECGAADKFTKELGFLVTKSTVRNMTMLNLIAANVVMKQKCLKK